MLLPCPPPGELEVRYQVKTTDNTCTPSPPLSTTSSSPPPDAKFWNVCQTVAGPPPTQEKTARSRALLGQAGLSISTISQGWELLYSMILAGWLAPHYVTTSSSSSSLTSKTFQSLKMFLPQPTETCQNCNYKVVKFRWQTLKEISKLLHNLIST